MPITKIVKENSLTAREVGVKPVEDAINYNHIQINFNEYPPESITAVQYATVAGRSDSPQSKRTELKLQKTSGFAYEIKISDLDFENYTDMPTKSHTPEVTIALEVAWGENVCEYGFIVALVASQEGS